MLTIAFQKGELQGVIGYFFRIFDREFYLKGKDLLWRLVVLGFFNVRIKMFPPMWSMALQIWELLGLML